MVWKRPGASGRKETHGKPRAQTQEEAAPPAAGGPAPGGGQEAVEIIPWGSGEIGKNITAFRYRDEIFVLDGGLAFPDEGMPGVDLLIPRVDFLMEHRHQIKAWVLTHGHEDHIGGFPSSSPWSRQGEPGAHLRGPAHPGAS